MSELERYERSSILNMSSSTFIDSRLFVRVSLSNLRSSCACFSCSRRSLSDFISMIALKFSTSRSRCAIFAFASFSSSAYARTSKCAAIIRMLVSIHMDSHLQIQLSAFGFVQRYSISNR